MSELTQRIRDLKMRALIVDDSKAMRLIIRNVLREVGFDILEASHGGEALDLLRQSPGIRIVLVDWHMPGMSGLEFVANVRSDPTYDEMPVVFVTSEIDMDHVAQALEAGANEYIMKPFTKDVILEKLGILGIAQG